MRLLIILLAPLITADLVGFPYSSHCPRLLDSLFQTDTPLRQIRLRGEIEKLQGELVKNYRISRDYACFLAAKKGPFKLMSLGIEYWEFAPLISPFEQPSNDEYSHSYDAFRPPPLNYDIVYIIYLKDDFMNAKRLLERLRLAKEANWLVMLLVDGEVKGVDEFLMHSRIRIINVPKRRKYENEEFSSRLLGLLNAIFEADNGKVRNFVVMNEYQYPLYKSNEIVEKLKNQKTFLSPAPGFLHIKHENYHRKCFDCVIERVGRIGKPAAAIILPPVQMKESGHFMILTRDAVDALKSKVALELLMYFEWFPHGELTFFATVFHELKLEMSTDNLLYQEYGSFRKRPVYLGVYDGYLLKKQKEQGALFIGRVKSSEVIEMIDKIQANEEIQLKCSVWLRYFRIIPSIKKKYEEQCVK